MATSEQPDDGRGAQGRPSDSYTGQGEGGELAQMLSDMARSLQDEKSIEDTLQGIAAAAVGMVPGAEHAGLTVVRGRREVTTRAASDDLVRRVDRVQYEAGQGPCLDAVYDKRTVRLSDMATEDRWPDFTRRALGLGVHSMLSFQLYVQHDDLGALNLYSAKADAFDDESENVGLLLASHAAIAMAGAQKEHDLSVAISARDLIGQAKGILMERHKITGDQAFHLLARTSQHANIKLAEIARYLVETGELTDIRDR
ncbi:GAF and ANTAR domain-containing protein [Paractinoplanes hotanensis]|uniref:GAF and ANTAR domain-containing protein n=1 Tax=Paractinoplanes hotanensis TaxID=2906497 RepID=A0ABT0XWW5_9ACTN|nr:GAF and ANTAR domain-containing protein [Actinoplanes hotanensis]MCM4078254.1 GAF and ANTAR domain-containing protein [Actinoplanes hotanensis]